MCWLLTFGWQWCVVCVYMWRQEIDVGYLTTLFLSQGLKSVSLIKLRHTPILARLASQAFGIHPFLPLHLSFGLHCNIYHNWFLHGFWELNSGSHAYTACMFPNQSHFFFKKKIIHQGKINFISLSSYLSCLLSIVYEGCGSW